MNQYTVLNSKSLIKGYDFKVELSDRYTSNSFSETDPGKVSAIGGVKKVHCLSQSSWTDLKTFRYKKSR